MNKTRFATPMIVSRSLLWGAAAALAAALSTHAGAAQMMAAACGDLKPPGQVGPFDYRSIPADSKYLVETAHFPAKVENLQAGNSSSIGGDIDYTLRAIPNHPRALLSMTRLVVRTRTERPPGMRFQAECYFERASRLAPDDPMPHVIYANYLKGHQRMADVKLQLAEAERLRGDPSSFDFDYNLGLLYTDVGDFDRASVAAKRAYALGAPLPGLMKRLKVAGKWQE